MGDDAGHGGDPLSRAFAPLIGLPAWSVSKGYGSFLTLEFGTPHLRIREPIVAREGVSEKVRKNLARRRVHPAGEWHLWIYCCYWRMTSNRQEIAWTDSPDDQIDVAAHEIDGQSLTEVAADPGKGTSTFRFDQGALLETWPLEEGNYEQWMLYMRTGNVLTYRADGCYQICPKDQTGDDLPWLPLSRARSISS